MFLQRQVCPFPSQSYYYYYYLLLLFTIIIIIIIITTRREAGSPAGARGAMAASGHVIYVYVYV